MSSESKAVEPKAATIDVGDLKAVCDMPDYGVGAIIRRAANNHLPGWTGGGI